MSVVGTQLKINLQLKGLGSYRMSDIDFTCDFYINPGTVVSIPKSEMVKADDDNYIALLDTTTLGSGIIQAKITAQIPDDDFPEGFRREIAKTSTGISITS